MHVYTVDMLLQEFNHFLRLKQSVPTTQGEVQVWPLEGMLPADARNCVFKGVVMGRSCYPSGMTASWDVLIVRRKSGEALFERLSLISVSTYNVLMTAENFVKALGGRFEEICLG
jgi:hypothetical protein